LHAFPTRWYEKTVDKLSGGARRRWTSAVAVTAVVATASATAWVVMDDNDPTSSSVTTAAAFSPVTRTATITAASPASMKAQAGPATPFGAADAAGISAGPVKAPASQLKIETAAATTDTATTAQKAAAEKTTAKPKKTTKKTTKKAKKYKVIATGRCGASYYDEGQMTASGERFNPNALTAAHKTLRMGTKVRVTNPHNGKSVIVRINDRGPYISGRCLDLSRAAFDAIGSLSAGTMTVKYAILAR
jgi:rare lipoprotein A